MADRIYTTQADSGVTQDFDGAWHGLGTEFRLSAAGLLVGGRIRYPSSDPANFMWGLYQVSGSVLIASFNAAAFFGAGATNSAWNSFTSADFVVPGDVALQAYPAQSYRVVQATNSDFLYKAGSYPIGPNGIVTAVGKCYIDGGSGLQFPSNTGTDEFLFADVEIEALTAAAGFRAQYFPPHLLRVLYAERDRRRQHSPTPDIDYVQEPTDVAGLKDPLTLDVGLVRTDSVGLKDASFLESGTLVTANDNVGLKDPVNLNVGKVVTDSAGLQDPRSMTIGKVVTDSAGLKDPSTVAPTRFVTQTDSAGLKDTTALTTGKVVTDSAGLKDTTALTTSKVVTDSVGLKDPSTLTSARLVEVTDSVGLRDGTFSELTNTAIIPIRTLTASEIITGSRFTRYYLDLLDVNDVPVARLDGVTDGKLYWTANALVKGGGELTVKDVGQSIDWLTARFRPVMAVEGLPVQPLGVFLASETPESWGLGRSWNIKLLDKTTIPDQDIITELYVVAAGTVVTTEVESLIASTGVTNYAITASAATLPGDLVWLVGTSKLRIINDLLSIINYFSLYADFNGQLRSEPYVLPAARPIVYEFIDGANCIYKPDFVRDVDVWKIPNRVLVIGMGDGTTAALTSVIDNTDATSPYSIANRGRVIGYTEEGVEAADQDALDAYARRRLNELTTPTASVGIEHAPVPGLAVNQTVRFRRIPANIDARHTVSQTEITLKGNVLAESILREVVDL